MSKKIIITTKIFLFGVLPEDPHTFVEVFAGTEQELKKRLLELQKEYCQDEKPTISKWTSNTGKTFIEAISNSDWNYVARIK